MLIILTSIVLAAAAAAPAHAHTLVTVPTADCAAYDAVRERLSVMQQAVARGADESTLEGPDVVTPLRTCFRTQVMPQLTRAESDEKLIDRAAHDFTIWGRQAALLGIEEQFAAEFDQAHESIQRGLTHAYGVARDKCVRRNDLSQIPEMLRLLRWAELWGIPVSADIDADIAACFRGDGYFVQVRQRSVSEKRGVGSSFTYNAVLRRAPGGDGDLAGDGTWSGFIVAHDANCSDGARDRGQRFEVAGNLETSGNTVDMAAPGAKPDLHLLYVLGTVDWPLKPVWGGDGPFATTADEKDAIKGLGSTMSPRPIRLTGAETTQSSRKVSEGSKCSGQLTVTTDVQIVQLRGRAR